MYSAEQIQQIREQNALVQRAAATAQSFTELATSSYDAAQVRVHALSDTMLVELQKVQVSSTFFSLSHWQSKFWGHNDSMLLSIV